MQLSDIRHLKRFSDILTILAKYGFDEIVQRLEMPGAQLIRKVYPVDTDVDMYTRIRCAITDLGPTFIKFGQLMSLRPDLLPTKLIRELEKLQDNVPPVETEKIIKALEDHLGKPVQEVFSIFDVDPVAAASMSQVHKGVLAKENLFVAVKVRRPGIVNEIMSDLNILETIGLFVHDQFEELRPYDLPNLISAIRANVEKEIDFSQELLNMRTARSFTIDDDVYIPETYDKYCGKNVLIMEYVQGERFKDMTRYSSFERKWVARLGLNAAVKQILEDGFFHADPHPGNLLVRDDMSLCLIDWGLAGRLTERDRFLLIEVLRSIADKDSETLVRTFLRLSNTKNVIVDSNLLEREFLTLLDRYTAVPIKEMNFGELFMSMISLLRSHSLPLPADLAVMIKALVTAEGSARQTYPELNVIEEVSDYVHKLAMRRYRPEKLWRNVRNSFAQLWFTQQDLPRRFEVITSKLERGEFGFKLQLDRLDKLVSSFESASNRLTAGIVTGSIIIGSSMIITTGVGPYLFGFPALGVIGYLLSVILGIWLLYTILRTK